ncbi:hypothetical protein HDU96_004768 [Phlyctochytrium bullatum]|nr:hypothetical protein HDU96_004768 [Phlyctochytrium bullatum]
MAKEKKGKAQAGPSSKASKSTASRSSSDKKQSLSANGSGARLPKKSVGEILAELSNPSPDVVFDPDRHGEDAFRLGSGFIDDDAGKDSIAEAREKAKQELARREHYVEVGPSALRRRAGVELAEGKYGGKKVSRKELFELEGEDDIDGADDVVEDDDEVEYNDEDDDDDDDDDDGEGFESGDDDAMEESFDDEIEMDVNDGEDEDDDDDDLALLKTKKSKKPAQVASRKKVEPKRNVTFADFEDDDFGDKGEDDDDEDDDDDEEYDDDDEDDDDEEEEEEDEFGVPKPSKKAQKKAGKSSSKIEEELEKLAEEEKKLVQNMAKSAEADLEKGYHVRAQMIVWDNLLDTRMQFQKALTLVNTLPKFDAYPLFFLPPLSPAKDDEDPIPSTVRASLANNIQQATDGLANLIADLLRLRATLVERNEVIKTEPEDYAQKLLAKLKKRKRADDGKAGSDESAGEDEEEEDDDEAAVKKKSKKASSSAAVVDPSLIARLSEPHLALEDSVAFDAAFKPFRDATIEKWSAKVNAASSGQQLVGANKKFKTINTSVLQQIANVLGDRDRLVKRTQLVRDGGVKPLGVLPKPKALEKADGDDEDEDVEEKALGKAKLDAQLAQYDTEMFDDGDFYQQLLKELIESRMGDTDDPVILGMKFAELKKLQTKKKKKVVDLRATKGRKLRFNTHEKILNFMAPEPRGSWHEEKVEELFASLFGGLFSTKGAESNGQAGEGLAVEEGAGDDAGDRQERAAKDGLSVGTDGEILMPTDGLRIFG